MPVRGVIQGFLTKPLSCGNYNLIIKLRIIIVYTFRGLGLKHSISLNSVLSHDAVICTIIVELRGCLFYIINCSSYSRQRNGLCVYKCTAQSRGCKQE